YISHKRPAHRRTFLFCAAEHHAFAAKLLELDEVATAPTIAPISTVPIAAYPTDMSMNGSRLASKVYSVTIEGATMSKPTRTPTLAPVWP
ncbi:MAG TPA: hypothetical protein VGC88_03580, partial [Terriglobales bacterium]